MTELETHLGPVRLRTPLIAASGTVGSVVDFARVIDFSMYGAAVAKSVSPQPWSGKTAPRMAPAGQGMLNGIGIQNPGIAAWSEEFGPRIAAIATQVWGSSVAEDPGGFADVADALTSAGVAAVEVNLSCPNLGGKLFALDAQAAANVISEVRSATHLPVGAKLSPNAVDVVAVAAAVAEAGADWVVLTNTVWGAAIDVKTRRPKLSGVVGGYSGAALKPIAMRCVWEVAHALPGLPIVGCGGIGSGSDAVEYLLAGASAVAVGTEHFATPRVGRRIVAEIERFMKAEGVSSVGELVGGAVEW